MRRGYRVRHYWSGVLSVLTVALAGLLLWTVGTPVDEGQPWHLIVGVLSFVGTGGCAMAAGFLYFDEGTAR